MKDLKTMRTAMMKEYLSGKTECVPAFRRRSVKPHRDGCPVRGGWQGVTYRRLARAETCFMRIAPVDSQMRGGVRAG
jgi:hypothetical protein